MLNATNMNTSGQSSVHKEHIMLHLPVIDTHEHTHTHYIISVTFHLSFILRSLNTNTHNQIMVSGPL